MANHKSALKRMRQNTKRYVYNRTWRNRARTVIKAARTSMDGDNVNIDDAREQVRAAVRELDKAVSRGVLHKRNAARRKSRLMRKLAQLES
jgi:small subunit ribosomal protein S20